MAKTNRFVVCGQVVNEPVLQKNSKDENCGCYAILQTLPDKATSWNSELIPFFVMNRKAHVFLATVHKGDIIYAEGRILTAKITTKTGRFYVRPTFKIIDFIILKKGLCVHASEKVVSKLKEIAPYRYLRRKDEE